MTNRTNKTNMTYMKFLKRWEEVVDMPPQTFGPLTSLYKRATRQLKVMPWPWFVGASFFIATILYLMFGSAIASLVTILQRGF